MKGFFTAVTVVLSVASLHQSFLASTSPSPPQPCLNKTSLQLRTEHTTEGCEEAGCKFNCSNGNFGILCDDKNDCGDWEDERSCPCNRFSIDCICLHNQQACTGEVVPSSGQCVKWPLLNDGVADCQNSADESMGCEIVGEDTESVCIKRVFKCTSHADKRQLVLAHSNHRLKCHDVVDYAAHRSDDLVMIPGSSRYQINTEYWICVVNYCSEINECNIYNAPQNFDFFQCEDTKYISLAALCNGEVACADQSDEYRNVPGFKCELRGTKRPISCVIPQTNLFDSHSICERDTDVCFGEDGRLNTENCFQCLDKLLLISVNQVCDGIVDCYDLSDECLCESSTACESVQQMYNNSCASNNVKCKEHGCVSMDTVLCEDEYDCGNQVNFKYCGALVLKPLIKCKGQDSAHIVQATKCDGRPECEDFADECNSDCYNRPSYCECAENKQCSSQYCTGWPAGSDMPMTEMPQNCLARFYCAANNGMISIDIDKMCDGCEDCVDGSDESTEMCKNRLYFCQSGFPKAVKIEFVNDGVLDCDDGSDENHIRFSDRRTLIANPILRTTFWVMGTLSFLGNLVVMLGTIAELKNVDEVSNMGKIQKHLLINLSFSDFLMSIYLLAVSFKGFVSTGFYTECEYKWRSSSECTIVGTIAWVSMQSSANTLALLTFYRLLGLYKPFIAARMNLKWVAVSITISWMICLGMGLVPSAPWFLDYFTGALWYPNFFTRASKVSKDYLLKLARDVSFKTDIMVPEAIKILDTAFPGKPIKGLIGYYGGTCICLPHVFVAQTETAAGYTMFVISYNFLIFIFIGVGYFFIINAAKNVQSTNCDEITNMQVRVLRLIFADFLTRMPVCLLFYLRYYGMHLNKTMYIIFAGVLLPINAVFNPFLYTRTLRIACERIWSHKSKISPLSIFKETPTTNDSIQVPPPKIKHIA